MRLSEFRLAVAEEFGDSYGQTLVRDLAVTELGSRTVGEAVESGVPLERVWRALCKEMGVPPERWHGRGRPVARQ
ncbi:DUF3046 domain-containing protein [Lysinibacter sp. HNR]|uniref:DUF3046 domain-containing protein n=1 Tax=Lysinibacter sp. HNR TaxID=3031408 RepID=UPI00243492A6|nr:DUF3046 domain-containing protein [Lysinibacter sp. HNR]WGD38276.1 DUF3046 domain-containing protein [Lysinibacter sp. HNR]